MAESRLKNSLKNGISGIGTQIITIILNFICRTVFIKILGNQYLGVNGLFSNILTMLSLSELGIGTAIVYNMYKAVGTNDKELQSQLLSFYAKVYTFIGITILLLGGLCVFFLQYLIKDNPFDKSFLQIAFILMLINNAASYFWSYRSCILFAHQKNYICNIYNMIILSIGKISEILIILYIKDYIAYLIVQVIITIINNYVIYYISKKTYPEIKVSFNSKLPKHILNDIIEKVKSLLIHSFSTAINFGTDNIIISKFVGIEETGFYANYLLLINTVKNIFNQFTNGIIASMGNLIVTSDNDKIYDVFLKINFFCFWIYGTICSALYISIDPFIDFWTGKGHLLNRPTVCVILLSTYILGVRQSIMITRNASGLYTKDKSAAVIKPIVNVFFSLFLVKKIGILGVFLGTVISEFIADLILFPIILFNNLFKGKIISYFYNYAKNITILIFSCFITSLFHIYIKNYLNEILLFFISLIFSIIIFNIIFYITNMKSKELFFYINLLYNKTKKR